MASSSASPNRSPNPPPTQTPERSGLPSAVRGIGFSAGFWSCATSESEIRTRAASPIEMRRRVTCPAPSLLLAARAGRRSRIQLAAVGKSHLSRMGLRRIDARPPAKHGDSFADLHGVALPALPDEHVRGIALEFPLSDDALVIFHVHVEVDVRVEPVDPRDSA